MVTELWSVVIAAIVCCNLFTVQELLSGQV